MRVLWISDSPDTPSGFGNVTRFVCGGLAKRGHQVSILGWQTMQQQEWNGCQVYPASVGLGSRSLFPFLVRHRPEIVIALADVWWLPYFSAPHIRRQMLLTDTPWALYFPIDGNLKEENLPASWVELLGAVDIPIAMSEFGRDTAQRSGIDCKYIPHGVDSGIFYPPADRQRAKAEVDAAGKFMILSDSRNQPRKMLPRLLDIFAKFAKGRSDALLHLHTDPDDEFTKSGLYSYDVRADLRHLGIESQVRFSSGHVMSRGGGLPLEELARYYRAADVHLLASSGEGFGLPTLQAAAAGAVPMAGAYSASLELVSGHGEAVAISDWSENEFGIRRALIDVDDAVTRLARLYDDRELLAERSRLSAEFALPYNWDRVLDQWDDLLRSTAEAKRRISRVPIARAMDTTLASRFAPQVPSGSVTVNVVEHHFGRLEAGLVSDTKGHLSDVRIPSVQESCVVNRLKVIRNAGYIGVAPGNLELFYRLKAIFPVIQGWVPLTSGEALDVCDFPSLQTGEKESQTAHKIAVDSPWRGRYDLSQSVLLFNMCAELKDELLIEAALFGVVCVGSPGSEAQETLWPELAMSSQEEALVTARRLLTNNALLRRISVRARSVCVERYGLDEAAMADSLRELHASYSRVASN